MARALALTASFPVAALFGVFLAVVAAYLGNIGVALCAMLGVSTSVLFAILFTLERSP